MSTVEVREPDGIVAGSVELPGELFDAQANLALMHQVVVAQLGAARQGTHSAKTRGGVSGGGKKPYRQKGTGRARQGSIRAPQFTGGGVVHPPEPRAYDQRTPKKMKAAALRGALSDRARGGRVHVVTRFVTGDTPSTRDALAALGTLASSQRVLVVADRADVLTWKSLRNVPSVHLLDPGQLNTYDVLVSDELVFTQPALQAFLRGKGHELPDLTAPETPAGPALAEPEPEAATQTEADAEPEPEAATRTEAADERHPYGPASHAPLEDGGQPEGFPVKGKAGSKLYHVPGSSHYERTTADVWFASAEDAEAAGFALPPSQRAKEGDE